ncbi:MAG TPA: hypothetical protein VF134_05885 [Candidatus Dormibacteraeota bacterium]
MAPPIAANAVLLLITAAFLLLLAGANLIDVWLALKGEAPYDVRIITWVRHNPVFGLVLTLIYGALLGHFFWS